MMDITEMKVGDRAVIIGYTETAAGYRAKLLALGLTRGATIELIGVAPMGDPLRLKVRGFELSLRRSEATILQLQGVE
jgi:ferrous iron transport protein A